jgi:hypothetical protein
MKFPRCAGQFYLSKFRPSRPLLTHRPQEQVNFRGALEHHGTVLQYDEKFSTVLYVRIANRPLEGPQAAGVMRFRRSPTWKMTIARQRSNAEVLFLDEILCHDAGEDYWSIVLLLIIALFILTYWSIV